MMVLTTASIPRIGNELANLGSPSGTVEKEEELVQRIQDELLWSVKRKVPRAWNLLVCDQ